MVSQERIDANSKSRIGTTNAERGKSRKIMAELLVTCLSKHEDFYKWLPSIFPQLGAISTKSIDEGVVDRGHNCDHEAHKATDFTPHQASSIQNLFRQNYPKQYGQLTSYAHDWLQSLMTNNLPNQGAPFTKSYWDMLQQGASFGYQSALSDKARPNPTIPPMPFVVNAGEDFIKKIYADGYGLVSSQITQGVITSAMDSINQGLTDGKSWTEISDDLHNQFQGKQYHWERLVRSEMAMAANAGTMAQARALNEAPLSNGLQPPDQIVTYAGLGMVAYMRLMLPKSLACYLILIACALGL